MYSVHFIITNLFLASTRSSAFAPHTSLKYITRRTPTLFSTAEAPSDVENEIGSTTASASANVMTIRNHLVKTAKELSKYSPSGVFLTLPEDISKFNAGVAKLEAIAPITSDESESLALGDWTLVATAKVLKIGLPSPSVSTDEKKKFSLPNIPDKLQNGITVTQRIRSTSESNNIDRVDNVIEINNEEILPAFLNPLKISNSKVVLVHKAKVESFNPFRTKISLQSIVLNVAGSNQNLDPLGADLLAVNIPSLTEWMNSGSFDTTYVDEQVRISRGTTGFFDETRVFVKKGVDIQVLTGLMEENREITKKSQFDKFVDAVEGVANVVGSSVTDTKEVIDKEIDVVSQEVERSMKNVKEILEDDIYKIEREVESIKSVILGEDSDEKTTSSSTEEGNETSEDDLTA
jgi:hypothetical protein